MNGHRRFAWKPLLMALAVCALALGCKSSSNAPGPPSNEAAGAGGASEPGGGADAGAAAEPEGGANGDPGSGQAGDTNMPGTGAGGAPTEPGSWDKSFWDDAVWQ